LRIDGQTTNGISSSAQSAQPSIDAIQSSRQTSNFAAEFGLPAAAFNLTMNRHEPVS
jgi:hypothetical protein